MALATAHLTVADTPPELVRIGGRRAVGLRLVGVTALLAAATIAVLAGLGVFHSMLAAGQYRLSELESEIGVEREAPDRSSLRASDTSWSGGNRVDGNRRARPRQRGGSDRRADRAASHRCGVAPVRHRPPGRRLALDQDAADRCVYSA